MKVPKTITFIITAFVILFTGQACSEMSENWTHYRGNDLSAIAKNSSAPLHWTPDSNIAWKTEIHDKGWSSPVVYDNQVWMTTASDDGYKMYAVCVDYNTGEILHDILLFTPDTIYRKHSINSYATPTAAIEEGSVYVHFGRYGTACLSTEDGSVNWKRTDLECLDIQGPAASVLIYKDLIILHYEGVDVRFIVGLDKQTGETVWRTDRPLEPYEPLPYIGTKAYVTPLMVNVNGQDMFISNGSAICQAFDPATGEEIWRVVSGAESTVAMPSAEGNMVYFYNGYQTSEDGVDYSELLAVDMTGTGDVTDSHVKWKIPTERLQLSTQLVIDGLIYTVESNNMQYCIDASTGEILWEERLRDKYNASPVYADGKIYFCSLKGKVQVLEHGRERKVLAENELEGEIWTTPAILRDQLLVRTSKYLYLIGE